MQRPPPSVRVVTIPFADLEDRGKDLSGKIGDGFGRQGLGIVAIADVPGYPELRKRLLRLAPRVANLPEEVKKGLEDPNSRYNFGWSHGKQKFESGKFDTFKGSYFANPLFDVPTTDNVLLTRFPSYCRPNIWPNDDLPELQTVMKQGMGPYVGESLEQTLARSRCHKGRLLYYFPQKFSKQKDGQSISSWCGWHTDYASLTGLTCGLFMRKSVEIPCSDSGAGLHIRSHDNRVVKVTFKDDELAYMTGETAEILSRGHLRATPHCVKQAFMSANVSRRPAVKMLHLLTARLSRCLCSQIGMRRSSFQVNSPITKSCRFHRTKRLRTGSTRRGY
ncbi:uncharacterized protein LOC120697889 isoform X5 [Panicum virgatum]|uniref:uncharacterized protein LOC120697889 isoform X5 n=1 Tax=Panicum virgatum TaxID=38727 RepID=UPI0019D5F6AA|nr:uncharacterized protein LOC120697889 isoform X5 [Panicum virgatum]